MFLVLSKRKFNRNNTSNFHYIKFVYNDKGEKKIGR